MSDNVLKQAARKSSFVKKLYRALKTAIVYPLKFTSLRTLQLANFPLKDLLNPAKTSILKVCAPYTLAGYPRLTNVYDVVLDIEKRNIDGAFVETGTWKGGCAAIMGAVAHRYGDRRTTWYLDSFEGMPDPTPEDGEGTEEITGDVLKASVSDVEELIFGKLKLPREKNIIVKGWFEDTIPTHKDKVGGIAVLRVDADFYEPIKYVLDELYPQIVKGGYIIFDDYPRWPGCRQAVHEYLDSHNLKPEFLWVGNSGGRVLYWKKD